MVLMSLADGRRILCHDVAAEQGPVEAGSGVTEFRMFPVRAIAGSFSFHLQ